MEIIYITGILLIVVFWIFWAETIRVMAGEDERVWFYLTLILPLMAIIYRLVKLR